MKCNSRFPSIQTILTIVVNVVVCTSLFVLSGCNRHKSPIVYYSGTAPFFSPIDSLRADGVQVIHLGQTYRLVISSDSLFKPHSANLYHHAHGVLNDVARLLNAYHVIRVRVAAYSDAVHSIAHPHKMVLTAQQAFAVQNYLSNRGLSVRLIYADGQGSQHAVAWNGTELGQDANRRIEISFRYIPKVTLYKTGVVS